MSLKQKFSQRINEAKLLPRVLAAYKNYTEKVIAAMADALIVTNRLGEIKKVNRAALELFGYSKEELINQSISKIIDYKFWQEIINQNYSSTKYKNIEVVCQKKTEEKILVAFSYLIIKNKIDGLEDIVYVGRDISPRERRKKRNNTQYAINHILSKPESIKQVIPKILQAICENLGWDLGELWTSNQYIEAIVQEESIHPVLRCVEIWSSRTIVAQEFKAITWLTTYTPSVGLPGQIWVTRSPLWMSHILHDAQAEKLGESQRHQKRCSETEAPTGRTKAAAEAGLHTAFGFPILDDQKILGVMIFLSRDVQPKDTDLLQLMISLGSQIAQFIKRKQAEEKLLESEEKYQELVENANDLIQFVTPYGRFEYVNHAWIETLGYTQEESKQINLFDIIHPDYKEECRQLFYHVMSGKIFEKLTTVFVCKNGQKIFVEGKINCKFVEGKPVTILGIFRNMSQFVIAEKALRHQQQQTERVLLNILPEAILNQLKEEPVTIAEHFNDVTVLFADIVGFTEIASQISAIQLVNILNQIFSVFDQLSEQYGVEKIKTIGDAYMVVGGLPRRRPDHTQAIALIALDMQTAIAQFNAENNKNFSIRIGIHTGPVVAGVIGIKKFTYDLWGDTVNIASRMESQGLAGKIQVTEATYHRLQNHFLFEKRGEIEIKGKGKMTTYMLINRK
jgi:adenylate cyclase